MKKIVLYSLFVLFFNNYSQVFAGTIRLMQYNLLYYTYHADYTDCDATTNNLDLKDYYLKQLIQYVKPDVFCVNEIGKEEEWANRLLNNVLNQNGISYYATIRPVNSWSTIGNRIFYDTRKLTYYNAFYVPTSVININAFKFYFNSPDLVQGDTIFITFIVCHLKSGSYDGNETTRYQQTLSLMNRLEGLGKDNYVCSGDFNSYAAVDSGIANVLYWPNPNFRFYDPINQLGYWHENETYSLYHTQSTRSGYEDACFSGGGFDDRFDFILVSPYVYTGEKGVKSINESYRTLGQDGRRFNESVISPANNSEPANIITALYKISDHLPVVMDFEIKTDIPSSIDDRHSAGFFIDNVVNPIRDKIEITLHASVDENLTFQIFTIEGKLLTQFIKTFPAGIHRFENAFNYSAGAYILRVVNAKNQSVVVKLIK